MPEDKTIQEKMYKDMKENWNGYDKKGNIVETFFGNYAEAVDYFNSEESNPRVERFNKEV